MKKIILFTLLCTVISQTFAQKEIFFNSTKPEDLKVESLKGIELQTSINPFAIFNSSQFTNTLPLYLGFFSEQRIAPTWTIDYSIGITSASLKMPIGNSYENFFLLGLKAGVEPRWYWSFKKRAINNHVKLNSGWFLSLPFSYKYIFDDSFRKTYFPTLSYKSLGGFTLMPTLGYRQAVTNNLFLEGSFGYGVDYRLSSMNNAFYSSFTNLNPEIKFKVAYTFK